MCKNTKTQNTNKSKYKIQKYNILNISYVYNTQKYEEKKTKKGLVDRSVKKWISPDSELAIKLEQCPAHKK